MNEIINFAIMETFTAKEKFRHLFSIPVIVAALGYFVDIYDLLLFGIVRVPSLNSLGIDINKVGTLIQDWQMFGLVLGGILWGVWFNSGILDCKYSLWISSSNKFHG